MTLDLQKIINEAVEEAMLEASFGAPDIRDVLKYCKKVLGCSIEETSSGYLLKPPSNITSKIITLHKTHKGKESHAVHDYLREIGDAYGVLKNDVIKAIQSNKPITPDKNRQAQLGFLPKVGNIVSPQVIPMGNINKRRE